jgi:hypothetical protein
MIWYISFDDEENISFSLCAKTAQQCNSTGLLLTLGQQQFSRTNSSSVTSLLFHLISLGKMQDAEWRDADAGFVASLPEITLCKKVGTDGDAKYIMYQTRNCWALTKAWNKGFYLGMAPFSDYLTYHFILNR